MFLSRIFQLTEHSVDVLSNLWLSAPIDLTSKIALSKHSKGQSAMPPALNVDNYTGSE